MAKPWWGKAVLAAAVLVAVATGCASLADSDQVLGVASMPTVAAPATTAPLQAAADLGVAVSTPGRAVTPTAVADAAVVADPTPRPEPTPTAPPAATATPTPVSVPESQRSEQPPDTTGEAPTATPAPSSSTAEDGSGGGSDQDELAGDDDGTAASGQDEPTGDEITDESTDEITDRPRVLTNVGHVRLAQAGPVPLTVPVAQIELIGFHEAGHPGSQPLNAAAIGVDMITMETRNRDTHARSAADIVVPPGVAVLAPATGTVIAANPYVLYCDYQDELVYIEPDGLEGWQVRVFHMVGVKPTVGTRVIAGETLIADSARMLPFESQVDEHTSSPAWPHVHVEVVDTSVPDTRPPGPGCD